MIAWASAHPAVAAWFCAALFIVTCAGLLLLGRRLLNRDGKRLELHHDGRVQPATVAPAVTIPAAVAEPLWPAPPAVDPYAAGPHEPGRFAGAAIKTAATGGLWKHAAEDLVPGAGGSSILLPPVTTARGRSFRERLLSRLVVDPSGCLLWTGTRARDGYGLVKVNDGRRAVVHRVVYEMFAGPIPEGLQLDHLCRVRHCANVAHLEPVTPAENTRRASALQTHCRRADHEFTPENTTYNSNGGRVCRACGRAAMARYRARPKGDDEPLKVDSPAPEDVPGRGAGTGGKRAADPVTPATTEGDQPPGPRLPEGDTPPLWPPQETGPGDHPWWLGCPPASPLAKARAAMDAVAALGASEYLGHLDGATAYADDAPWCPLSAETIARGMPAIKATDLDAVARVTAEWGVPR